ncbi:hypothetical protein CKO15_13450 [Halorhodospira abdelmalekii]|uniref:IS66 family transposase n=1 Tax=Halorhodospira abdelmalekii TaxID=421629 RepID=UPI0019081C8E|nr:IS66 family transposase [Halorhodospira abdelmalekii]MBK1736249.1 hypothetical protein [Halorhodospira abdelmalekii]
MSSDASQGLPVSPASPREAQLIAALAERDQVIAQQDQHIAQLDASVNELSEQLQLLKDRILETQRKHFGQSSERGCYLQLDLFHPQELPVPEQQDDEVETSTAAPGKRRKTQPPRGRRPLPPELPRETKRYDYDEETRAQLEAQNGGPLEEIGTEVTETLEYAPGHLYVKRHEVPKYAVRGEDGERTVVSPPRPSPPILGAQVGASLLAHTVVSKFTDHLPLNRISQQLARDGYEIPRQRLCDYSLLSASALAPLAELIRQDALACPVLHSDDTTVPQLEEGRRTTRTARLWLYLGRGRDDDIIPVYYAYTTNRSQEGPLEHLRDYQGYLQADAYAGYRNAERLQVALVWCACWAHARRPFEKIARKHKQRGRVHLVMKLIAAIYQVESRLRQAGIEDPELIRQERQRRTVPILKRLRRLLDRILPSMPPRGEFAKAISYVLNHWPALLRFTEDGRLEPDNNRGERAMRGVCVGRRNWNFTGSEKGGHALAILLTVLESCKQNGVNPRHYLIDVLERIQDHPVNRLHELLPYNWAPQTQACGEHASTE